jgi:hypothetical protein
MSSTDIKYCAFCGAGPFPTEDGLTLLGHTRAAHSALGTLRPFTGAKLRKAVAAEAAVPQLPIPAAAVPQLAPTPAAAAAKPYTVEELMHNTGGHEDLQEAEEMAEPSVMQMLDADGVVKLPQGLQGLQRQQPYQASLDWHDDFHTSLPPGQGGIHLPLAPTVPTPYPTFQPPTLSSLEMEGGRRRKSKRSRRSRRKSKRSRRR